MSLTCKMLRAMGIEDDKADQIIDVHAETVDALKQQVAEAGKGGEDAAEWRNENVPSSTRTIGNSTPRACSQIGE